VTWSDVSNTCALSFEREDGIGMELFRQVCLVREMLESNRAYPPNDLLIDPHDGDVTLEWSRGGRVVLRYVVRADGFEFWDHVQDRWEVSKHAAFPPFCHGTPV
jgi:hypothetical protein